MVKALPEGVTRVLARSIGDPMGIAENALEGAITGGIIGALTHRLYGDKAEPIDKKNITSGAKLGALHAGIGKILSRIPGEAHLEDRKSGSLLRKLFYESKSPIGWLLKHEAKTAVKSTHSAMGKAEKVVRNVYTFNRMKTALKEQMKDSLKVPRTQHNIKVIK